LHGAATIASERVLEFNDIELSIRETSWEERGIGLGKAAELRRIDQTNSAFDTSCSDAAPLSSSESSRQTLGPMTVSTPSLSGIGEDSPAVVDISKFAATGDSSSQRDKK
jgi:hypothetical protein